MNAEPGMKANILYVDDLQTNLILFQVTFEKDYNIILADSPAKALEILKEQTIQVLVTDQRMPEMTGTELLEIVAKDYPDIRRFLLTAYTDIETVVEAVNIGHIHGYINKPIQVNEVRASINNALEVYYLREKNNEILLQLEKANTELLNLDSVKTEILKLITREIRTPMNRIMGTIHLLKDKIQSEELIEVINILDSSVLRLERFSRMAEQISVIKSKEHPFKSEDISLRQLIEYTLVEINQFIRETDVDVRVDYLKESTIKGDFDLLISCMANTFEHAILHTGNKGVITVSVTQIRECPVCELSYTGMDYSERLRNELASHYSAPVKQMNLRLGIELALTQLIMETHGGFVEFAADGDQIRIKLVFSDSRSAGHE
jgi:CheY-like chemotaxis protein